MSGPLPEPAWATLWAWGGPSTLSTQSLSDAHFTDDTKGRGTSRAAAPQNKLCSPGPSPPRQRLIPALAHPKTLYDPSDVAPERQLPNLDFQSLYLINKSHAQVV